MSRAQQDWSEWDAFIIALRVLFVIVVFLCLYAVSIHDKLLSGSSWTCIESHVEQTPVKQKTQWNNTIPEARARYNYNDYYYIFVNQSVCTRYALTREAEE